MVSEIEVINIILDKFPDFEEYWKQEVEELWGEDNPGVSADMVVFSHYIKDLIIKNNKADEDVIEQSFILAEYLMKEGTVKVKDAVATCFLENLINAVAWERIPASSFIHLLGKESKKYCKAWDEFTGVKTEGL